MDELLGFNLDEIFEEETAKVPNFFSSTKKNADINRYFRNKMVAKIVSEFEANDDMTASSRMLRIFARVSPINYTIMDQVFDEAIHILKEKHEKYSEENPGKVSRYKAAAQGVEFLAERHFTREIEKELANDDLSTQWEYITKYLLKREFLSTSERFLYKALTKLKTEKETDIRLDKEKKHHQESLGILKETTAKEDKAHLRAKILLHLVITYRNLELPDQQQIEPVAKFFQSFMGGDLQKIRNVLKAPIAYEGKNPSGRIQSIKYLLTDLQYVREQLSILKLNDCLEIVQDVIADLRNDLDGE